MTRQMKEVQAAGSDFAVRSPRSDSHDRAGDFRYGGKFVNSFSKNRQADTCHSPGPVV
jgi:hypothetical protein